MLPLIAGVLTSLLSNNLPNLAQAVADKGVGYVQEKLGLELKPNMTPEEIAAVRIEANKHEEFRVNTATILAVGQEAELTKRQQADMASDSWLSKNIRPMTLIAIFVAYFLFTAMSAFGYHAQETDVQLLGQWGKIIFLAYLGGRTVEKLADMKYTKTEKDK